MQKKVRRQFWDRRFKLIKQWSSWDQTNDNAIKIIFGLLAFWSYYDLLLKIWYFFKYLNSKVTTCVNFWAKFWFSSRTLKDPQQDEFFLWLFPNLNITLGRADAWFESTEYNYCLVNSIVFPFFVHIFTPTAGIASFHSSPVDFQNMMQ